MPGRIERVDVAERRHRRRPTIYIAQLWYSYEASGSFYSGLCCRVFGSEREACACSEAARNKVIRVKYNPEKPDISCFAGFPEDSESGSAWLPEVLLERFLANRY